MDQLRVFIMNEFSISEDDNEFNADIHLFDYGYVDSFGAVKIINFIKQEYGVEISDQDLVIHSLNTIREIATLVYQRIQGE